MEMDKEEHLLSGKKTSAGALNMRAFLLFFLPSLMGVLLFLVPFPYNGAVTIAVAALADGLSASAGASLPYIMTAAICFSAVAACFLSWTNPAWAESYPGIRELFQVNQLSIALRVTGALFALMTLFQFGPEVIRSDITGGTVLFDLVTLLGAWFLIAGFLLPLLTDFGLMEFAGNQFRRIMKPLFRLPGRSSIDAFASWVGNGPLGVLITTKQYEEGYYTQREAATIATTFSVASIPFALIIISFIGLEDMFLPFYGSVVLAGLAAALICPRIPPLSRKKDTYYEKTGKQITESIPEGESTLKHGLHLAVQKAGKVTGIGAVAKKGSFIAMDIWFGLIPIVMAIGTAALIIAEFTPVFTYIAFPLVPVLQLLQIPEAEAAAPAMLVGFADMFLPAVIGSGIESELTRFIIAVISVNQLIYMSEIGVLLLRSKIPVTIGELFTIFIQRTIITLLLTTFFAHTFFF